MMKKKTKFHGFSLLEVSAVIVIIGIMLAGVFAGFSMVTKFRLSAAEALTRSSPISGITDNALWLETSLSNSFNGSEANTGNSISTWNDQSNSANKLTITAVSGGPVYSNTINYIHAVEFKPSVGYLQFDASFLNKTDYTIFVLEKRKSSGSNNYFFGADSSNANDSLALGYDSDTSVIHAQGSNSYNAYVSSYSDSKEKARLFAFSQSSTTGKKTYINGVLAAENPSDTTQLSGVTTLSIGQGYTGEIGEIAIFTRSLRDSERKAVEDYLGKKWSRKVNRDASPKCIGYTITDSGCDSSSAPCSAVSVAGVASPVSAANGATGSLTCNALGYNGATISYSCAGGSITAGTCGCATGYLNPNCATCDSTAGYISDGSGGCTLSAPVNSVAPALSSSSPTVGTPVSVTNGTWSPTPSSYTYQWYQDGSTAISGATSSSYTPVSANLGHTLLCKVTAINSAGSLSPISSNISAVVVTPSCSGGDTTDTTSIPGTRIHKFTSTGSATLTCTGTLTAKILVVGGGGGGADNGGGGGGGGVVYKINHSLSSGSYTITVGGGGAKGTGGNGDGGDGSPSSFNNIITAYGGGGGGKSSTNGHSGGSGGGGGRDTGTGGTATKGVGSGATLYGNTGGNSANSGWGGAGGGGGAGSSGSAGIGGSATTERGGKGGDGTVINITGSNVTYGGGGGGGVHGNRNFALGGSGGGGSGGAGDRNGDVSNPSPINAVAGTDGLGGGGGGSGPSIYNSVAGSNPAKGGSGIVIVSY